MYIELNLISHHDDNCHYNYNLKINIPIQHFSSEIFNVL